MKKSWMTFSLPVSVCIGVHSVGLSILVQFRDLHSSFCTNFANVIR